MVATMRRWTESEYREVFRGHPPVHPHAPEWDTCVVLGIELDRSPGAILAQWEDARGVVLGDRSAASRGLAGYLIDVGWID
jgi:hypothetical protein